MAKKKLIDLVNEVVEDSILLADGFDEAFLGIATRCGQPPVAVYDADRCIQLLVDGGMEYEEAMEYYSFNIEGAWVGPGTPCFIWRLQEWDDAKEEKRRGEAGGTKRQGPGHGVS